MDIEINTNYRGFANGEFTDYYGESCTIQKSSLATEDCIWLGLEEAEPLIMASNALRNGVISDKTTGWVEYPIPKDVFINTRMHLSREDVKKLLPLLQKFVDTGEII